MTGTSVLERRYRRLLALYPRAFRHEHEEALLGVLIACAGSGRRRPGPGESVDLIANALRLRLRPGAPRSAPTVFAAVWARVAFAGLFAFTSLSLIVDLAQDVPRFAPADMIAAGVHWLVALATLVLVLHGRSDSHYERQPAGRWKLDCASE